ncbi:antibiotic biosynthesis monooxygenase [Pseudonocardia spinosispora]|uniref:antibiotic biosynthesis monooxygenase n=1 Tax=Pseudonocardia spinosispora TaxID=103441 RepID=UPI00146FBDEB|nr:antibiotic biosynthesis monooxygenase [Pseudonocardia spinosispora]
MGIAVLPDIARADAGTILVSRWIVGDLARQRAAVDATMAEYAKLGAVPDGLLALSCFVSPDSDSVLNYAQWTSDAVHARFVESDRPRLAKGVDDLVPGIRRPGLVRYRLYREYRPVKARVGTVVMVSVEFDRPGLARGWVDAVLEAIREAAPVPGLISNYFHVSLDDVRVLNYAEWTDDQAHRAAIDSAGGPIGEHGTVGRLFRTMPGVVDIGFDRYQLYRSLSGS